MRILTTIILSLPLVGAYAIFSVGIVLIYRTSQVLNLAHGGMAMVPAYILYSAVEAGIPTPIAFVIAIASGAVLGLLVERVFVRRLRAVSATAQTVGTVAALGMLVSLAAKIWGTTPREAVRIFPKGFLSLGSSGIQIGELGLFAVMLVVSFALFTLLQRTDLGLMMRGTAESRLAASLHGVDPDRITEVTWALGGALAALSGILLAAVTNLNPYVLTLQALPGFIAALLGGLGSLIGAVVGAAIVGVTQGMVPLLGPLGRTEGAPQLLLTVIALAVMAARGKMIVASSDVREASGKADPTPTSSQRPGTRTWLMVAALGAVFPWFVPTSMVRSANLGAAYALVAISIVILTGWVGQISLGHASLVGIGGYTTGMAAGALGVPFPVSIIFAGVAAALAAVALGVVALRVRGLYLAVATLVFSWMASEYLFRQPWFIAHDQIPAQTIGGQQGFLSFDFTSPRVFYFVAWAIVGAATFAALNLRDFKVGRAFFAVRGSEMAAASLGIDVMRMKLFAFAISGALAGAAGNLLMSEARVLSPDQFTFNVSLLFLAIAVVGGLNSVSGAISSGLIFAGLTEVFFRVPALGGLLEIVSALLLVLVLLIYPGGLARIPIGVSAVSRRARSMVARFTPASQGPASERSSPKRRVPEPITRLLEALKRSVVRVRGKDPTVGDFADLGQIPSGIVSANGYGAKLGHLVEMSTESALPHLALGGSNEPSNLADLPRQERPALIEAVNVTVRFGGLTAVNDVSLAVKQAEIVGLIGPNGAGKTTLFNAIAGFNSPTSGTIKLYGKDVTDLPVHRRAAVGVARTFQAIQLFGAMTVFDNLLVATHVDNPSGLASNIWASDAAVREEEKARAKVSEVLALLDLTEISNRRTADLPFGLLRMVEVARAIVTGFRVIMLDEPASGLDNVETDRLIEVLSFIRGLGITQLLIEHDVRMVTSVSDYIYVLDQGAIIAQGEPAAIQRDPAVIAAYLGSAMEEVTT